MYVYLYRSTIVNQFKLSNSINVFLGKNDINKNWLIYGVIFSELKDFRLAILFLALSKFSFNCTAIHI